MKKQLKILLIDNEPGFIKMSRNALAISGYQVITAQDKKNGLEITENEAPDLVIIGAIEPQGDAFKLNKELRDNPRTQIIPILIVDVRSEEHSLKGWRWYEGMQMNAEDYTSRPIQAAELIRLVKRILDRLNSSKPVDSVEIVGRIEEILKRVENLEKLLTA